MRIATVFILLWSFLLTPIGAKSQSLTDPEMVQGSLEVLPGKRVFFADSAYFFNWFDGMMHSYVNDYDSMYRLLVVAQMPDSIDADSVDQIDGVDANISEFVRTQGGIIDTVWVEQADSFRRFHFTYTAFDPLDSVYLKANAKMVYYRNYAIFRLAVCPLDDLDRLMKRRDELLAELRIF